MTWNFRLRPGVGPLHANISKRGSALRILYVVALHKEPAHRAIELRHTRTEREIQCGGKPRERQTGSGIRFVLGLLFCTGMLALAAGVVLYEMFLRY